MPNKKQWIVITSGEQPLDEISKALEEKGFTVDSKLDAIGQIIGSGTEDAKSKAMKIKGVADIQPSNDINIGSPDAEMTW